MACDETEVPTFSISGQVMDHLGRNLQGIKIFYNSTDFVETDEAGRYQITGFIDEVILTATDSN